MSSGLTARKVLAHQRTGRTTWTRHTLRSVDVADQAVHFNPDKNGKQIRLEMAARTLLKLLCDEHAAETFQNPDRIAGILNKKRNVLGMMPHPERAAESILGSSDGLAIFESVIENM